MGNVNFQYRSKKDVANIEVRFTFKDSNDKFKSYYTRTNFEVSKEFWNEYKSNTRFRDVEKANLKTEIDKHLQEIETFILSQYQQETSTIQKDWLKDVVSNFYKPKNETSIPDNLLQFFDFYLSTKKHTIKASTLRKLKVVRNKIATFENDRERTFKIKDIDKSFLSDFIKWSKEKQYDNSVINDNFKIIRSVCNEAQQYDIEVNKNLHLLSTGIKDTPTFKIYLSVDELEQIIELNNLPPHLDSARDWLVISCYTGQRISDFKRFTPDMIRRQGGRTFIDVKQAKTDKNVSIPLLPIVQDILRKRNGNFPPTTTDQRYNYYIKSVCRLAKINESVRGKKATVTDLGTRKETGVYPKWQLISSHVGRRSFATNYYGKLPTSYIKDITGHGTEAMLLKYIGKTSKDTAKESYDLMLNLK
jgi:integrase